MTRFMFLATVLAVLSGALPAAAANTEAAPDAATLTGNTLIWPDAAGTNQFIRFGRFGDFDRYVPCTIESGDWALDADGILRLTFVSPFIAPQAFALSRAADGAIAMVAPGGETHVARLAAGDRLPWP